MIRTISRRISNLENIEVLARKKAEEAARSSDIEGQPAHIAKQELVNPEGLYLSNPLGSNDWFLPSNFVLSFGLLADLKILRNVGTPLDIQSNS